MVAVVDLLVVIFALFAFPTVSFDSIDDGIRVEMISVNEKLPSMTPISAMMMSKECFGKIKINEYYLLITFLLLFFSLT